MLPNDKEIINYFEKNRVSSSKMKDLARGLGVPLSKYPEFRRYVRTLVGRGLLDRSGKYYFVKLNEKDYSGFLRISRGGFGFVSLQGSNTDFFIPSDEIADALDGDFVLISPIGGFSRDRIPKARVVEVLRVVEKKFVGILRNRRNSWIVQVEGPDLGRDIFVSLCDGQFFEDGYRVEVEICERGSGYSGLKGLVTKIIGDPQDPRNDFERIVRQFGLPTSFSSQVEEECESRLKMLDLEISRRIDYRSQKCFTVDPDNASDFDDAIYIEMVGKTVFRVWVHIADVSFFIPEGSELDQAVCQRGTSVYLIDRVVHMLPENLASSYCSLVPNEDRLAVTVRIDVSLDGKIKKYSIEESVIRSSARLTYSNVQAVIDSDLSKESKASDFKKQINMLYELGRIRRGLRHDRGALDLEIPECRIVLDDEGKPVDIGKNKVFVSNGIVEECMLLANECVGRFCAKNELPVLYRVHAPPSESKIENIKKLYSLVGLNHGSSKQKISLKDLQNLITTTKNTGKSALVSRMVLRSMSRAEYTPNDVGHYGLAQNSYLHFTSPIRRFPDLLVHRIVKKLIRNEKAVSMIEDEKDNLDELGRFLSGRERHAEAASRAFSRIKGLRYMSDHIGESFLGRVSGVLRRGFFVEIEDMFIDGYCRLEFLNERFEFDPDRFRLIGRRSRRIIELGAQVKVLVVAVNCDLLEMELDLVSEKVVSDTALKKGKRRRIKKNLRPKKAGQVRKSSRTN